MIGAHILITDELAISVGQLAKQYPGSSVEIAYDDERSEQLWQVVFDDIDTRRVFIVNDETGASEHVSTERR